MERLLLQQLPPVRERCANPACPKPAEVCRVECTAPGCGPYFCSTCDHELHFSSQGPATLHDRRFWLPEEYCWQVLQTNERLMSENGSVYLQKETKHLRPDLRCEVCRHRNRWELRQTSTMALRVIDMAGMHEFQCATFRCYHGRDDNGQAQPDGWVFQSEPGLEFVNTGYFPASLTGGDGGSGQQRVRKSIRHWISVGLLQHLEVLRTQGPGMADHSMAKVLTEVGLRQRGTKEPVKAHVLGVALDEFFKLRCVYARALGEPVQQCLICDGLEGLGLPAGPVVIDGCLKLLNFMPKYPEKPGAAYFQDDSLFLAEERKHEWAKWLEAHGLVKNSDGKNDAAAADNAMDTNLHCAREVGQRDKRLASHGLEEAICAHNTVLGVSNMVLCFIVLCQWLFSL